MINLELIPLVIREKLKIDSLESYLKFQSITKYKIVKDKLVINQSIKLRGLDKELPISIESVNGSMDCKFNKLENLNNFPTKITGDLNLSSNSLKSLDNIPIVMGNIELSMNKELSSLSGIQSEIYGNLIANNCNIQTIGDIKQLHVVGNVNLSHNSIKSLNYKDSSIIIDGELSVMDNQIMTEDNTVICKSVNLMDNPINAKDSYESGCKVW